MAQLPVHRQPKEDRNDHTNEHGNGSSRRKQPQLSTLQKHFVAASGEFCGTFMFLYFSFACQIMLHTQRSEVSLENGGFSATMNIYTALVYGFSLLVNVWAFYRISGGLFNPAVSLTSCTRRLGAGLDS
jgi:aquaporin related protein